MSRSRRRLVAVLLFLASLAGAARAEAWAPRPLSANEARSVLEAYLGSIGFTRKPGFSLDRMNDRFNPTFFFFSAMFDNPNGASSWGITPSIGGQETSGWRRYAKGWAALRRRRPRST